MTVSSAFLSHVLLLAYGLPLLCVLNLAPLPAILRRPQDLVFCYLLGELVVVLLSLLCSAFGVELSVYTYTFGLVLTWGILVYPLLRQSERTTAPPSSSGATIALWTLSFIAIAIYLLPHTATAFFATLSDTQANAEWYFRAKVFFFEKGIPLSFLQDPHFLWSNPTEPPAVALLASYHAIFLGEWDDIFAKHFLLIHWFFALCAIAVTCQRRGIPPLTIAAVIIFLDQALAHGLFTGRADAFISIVLLLAILQDSARLRIALFSLVGLSAAYACLWIVLFYLILLTHSKLRESAVLESISAACVLAPWWIFVRVNDITSEFPWSFERALALSQEQLTLRITLLGNFALESFLGEFGYSGALLLLFALLVSPLLAYRLAHRDTMLYWLYLCASLLLLPLYFLSTSLPITWILERAFIPLISFPLCIAVLLLALNTALMRKVPYFSD